MATTKKTSTTAEKFSTNKNLNTVLTKIYNLLLGMGKTKAENIEIVRDYRKEFPKEPDYNIAQFGNLLTDPVAIRQLYVDSGYSAMKKMSDDKIWDTYLKQIGYIVKNAKVFK